MPLYPLCQCADILWVGIASHKAYAGDSASVGGKQTFKAFCRQRSANFLLQMRTVAPIASVGAPADIDGECHLIGNLLKDDIVGVVKHYACSE